MIPKQTIQAQIIIVNIIYKEKLDFFYKKHI